MDVEWIILFQCCLTFSALNIMFNIDLSRVTFFKNFILLLILFKHFGMSNSLLFRKGNRNKWQPALEKKYKFKNSFAFQPINVIKRFLNIFFSISAKLFRNQHDFSIWNLWEKFKVLFSEQLFWSSL